MGFGSTLCTMLALWYSPHVAPSMVPAQRVRGSAEAKGTEVTRRHDPHTTSLLRRNLLRSLAVSGRRIITLYQGAGIPRTRWVRWVRDPVQPTFDVFDTLLTYTVVPPKMIWSELARRAVAHGLIADSAGFLQLRRRAPLEVRSLGGSDVLESIYWVISNELGLDEESMRRLASLELDVTAACLVPVPPGRRMLERARLAAATGNIIFLSDMYLPSRFIRDQLSRYGLWCGGDQLWVSGESGARKADGSLFRLVASMESPSGPTRFVHTGDHPVADRQAARWTGFEPRPFTDAVPSRLESLTSRSVSSVDDVNAWIAGASRQARLELCELEATVSERVLQHLTVDASGPLLVNFVLWVLERATRHGIDRLYFPSPRCDAMFETARSVNEALEVGIELRQLFGGWGSWQRAANLIGSQHDPIAIRTALLERRSAPGNVEVSELARLLGLEVADLEKLLPADAFSSLTSPRLRHRRSLRRQALNHLAQPRVLAEATKLGESASEPTIEGLLVAGIGDARQAGIVGITGRGAEVDGLQRLLAHLELSPVRGYFINTDGSWHEGSRAAHSSFLEPRPRHSAELRREAELIRAVALAEPVVQAASHFITDVSSLSAATREAASEQWQRARQDAFKLFLARLLPHLRPEHLETSDPQAMSFVLRFIADEGTGMHSSVRESEQRVPPSSHST